MAKKIVIKSKALDQFEKKIGGLANIAPKQEIRNPIFDLNKLLDDGMHKLFQEIQGARPRIAHIHVSELADWCPRRFLYHKLTGIEYLDEEPPEETWPFVDDTALPMRKKWHRGNIYHDVAREAFRRAGVLFGDWKCPDCGHIIRQKLCTDIDNQTTCKKCKSPRRRTYHEVTLKRTHAGIVVAGHIDCLIKFDKYLFVVEIKSEAKERWAYRHKPDDKHAAQMMTYQWLGKFLVGIVLYLNEDFEFRPFWFQWQNSFVDWIQGELNLVSKLENPTDVPRGCLDAQCWKAKNCPWRTQCFTLRNVSVT